jgi:hypothetical protein
MTEALVSGLLSLIIFAFGYGRLSEKVKSLESKNSITDHELKEIGAVKVLLEGIRKDIEHIKEKIDE